MDFDEEMYAPLPDELEWLENAANFPPDEEYPDEDDDLLELSGEPPEEDPADPDSRKRRRPGDAEVPGDTEKRSKGCGEDGEGAERDEDWLRYSPRKGEDVVAEIVEEAVVEEKMVSRFASEIDGDFVPVTGFDGDRVYVKACSGLGEAGGRCGRLEMPSRGLLSESIEVLMDRLNDEAIQKALQESFGTPSCSLDSTGMMVNERLWVDKYAPKSFLDLLSDEQTNREVLLWLKQWDSSVFGSEIRTTADDVLSSLRRHSSIVQPQKNFDRRIFSMNGRNSFNSKISEQSNDTKNNYELSKEAAGSLTKKTASSPPEHKVLLLCGPPGLGKTTLAHVAAKHCGYRVVEINASDERSSSTIESKILDAVQMNSVMTDSKPKCLVIDEIDGALREGKGAVEVILKMISAEKKSNTEPSHSESTAGKVHSKRRRKTITLSRPVICICNDLYSPVLRPLRQVAKVHTFVQPTINRVVNRLRFICGKEGFRTSSVALSALAECTECDIRSCLNTLQFLHRKKENLNILDIHSQVVGRKDVSRTAFDVWKEVLQQRKQKRGKLENFAGNLGGFEFLYNLLSNRGEYELTMDGIYENFLQLSYHDPALCKTVGCLDVLGISDSLNKFVLRTQQMSLHAYQPFVAICAKNLVAQVEKPHIEWPRSLQRCRTILIEKNDLFKCWHNNLSPSISRHLSMESFVQDVLSPLLHILNPPTLRPVALHLLSEKEKENLSELVNTMVSYSITYKSSVPESMPKAQRYNASSDITSMTLYPPIDNFINFKDHQIQLYELSSSVKHMLLHEVEKQKILCEGIGRSADANDENNRNQFLSHRSVTKEITKNEMQKNKHVPDSSQISAAGTKSQDAGNSRKTARHPSSFFDRFRKKSNDAENPESSSFLKPTTFERDQRPFLLKYNEGFTNAIKRPVRMRELLQ